MGNLLLSANGRIARARFLQGMVILTVASVLVSAGSVMVGSGIGALGLVLIYPYVCVFGKRLHDNGRTAWWVIPIWVASLVLSFILGLILGPFFTGAEELQIQKEMAERMAAGDWIGAMEGAELLGQRLLPLNLVSTVAVNVILALGIGALSTQPEENQYGPVPAQV